MVGTDLRLFVPLVERFPAASQAAFFGSGWVVVVGSAVMALWIRLGNSTQSRSGGSDR